MNTKLQSRIVTNQLHLQGGRLLEQGSIIKILQLLLFFLPSEIPNDLRLFSFSHH